MKNLKVGGVPPILSFFAGGFRVERVQGAAEDGVVRTVAISPAGTPARNPAFDVTPARLVTALITERGVCAASEAGLLSLYPEQQTRAA